jgi:hypothetical protein
MHNNQQINAIAIILNLISQNLTIYYVHKSVNTLYREMLITGNTYSF